MVTIKFNDMVLEVPFKQARNFTRGRIRPVQLIVIHSMEAQEKGATAENVAAYFARTNVKASAHYCVDNNSAVQCVRLEDTAWHCKNANANGVGIEHAGFAKQTEEEWLDDYGRAMLEISAQIAAGLCRRFNIPARRAKFAGDDNPQVIAPGFCGHVEVPGHGVHYDPGAHFPWAYYLERVQFYIRGEEEGGDEALNLDAVNVDEALTAPASSSPAPSVPAQTLEGITSPVPAHQPGMDFIQASIGSKKRIWATVGGVVSSLTVPAWFLRIAEWAKENQMLAIMMALVIIAALGGVVFLIHSYIKQSAHMDEKRMAHFANKNEYNVR